MCTVCWRAPGNHPDVALAPTITELAVSVVADVAAPVPLVIDDEKREEKKSPDVGDAPSPVVEAPTVQFAELYRYADTTDRVCLCVAFFLAACNGLTMPSFSLIFGGLLNAFNSQAAMLNQVHIIEYNRTCHCSRCFLTPLPVF